MKWKRCEFRKMEKRQNKELNNKWKFWETTFRRLTRNETKRKRENFNFCKAEWESPSNRFRIKWEIKKIIGSQTKTKTEKRKTDSNDKIHFLSQKLKF
jgi:hypothetical protein